ncbi:MAG: 4'-phosphopantetheinyl transferase superfamily protein [Moraxellaceae bacterium]|nr:4'-phosphopantetheinyl transferase superfamily protein [Moraxellaceae bacterium]
MAGTAWLHWLRDDAQIPLMRLLAALPDAERRECESLASPARQRGFALSRCMLRNLLHHHRQCAPGDIRFSRAENGRLQLAKNFSATGLQISLSHTDGMTAVICADAPCGVDIETVRERRALAIARRYFTASEIAWLEAQPATSRTDGFLRLWTLKEAGIKALGRGIAGNLDRLEVVFTEGVPEGRGDLAGLSLWQTAGPDYWLAAVVADSRTTFVATELALSDLFPS